MSEPTKVAYPAAWADLARDFVPSDHFMQIERFDKRTQKKIASDYLNVQNRMIWFIRDQRALITAGLATTSYVLHTELVELDREGGWAHFKTRVRDVLGNEATMYGSESVKDFPDYIEKASTKSLGRALLLLGYGTQAADELDEGERVVDSPVARPTPIRAADPQSAPSDADGEAVTMGRVRNTLFKQGFTVVGTQDARLRQLHLDPQAKSFTPAQYQQILQEASA